MKRLAVACAVFAGLYAAQAYLVPLMPIRTAAVVVGGLAGGALTLILIRIGAGLVSELRETARRNAGKCETCGYNLFGNISGACPECGAKIVAQI